MCNLWIVATSSPIFSDRIGQLIRNLFFSKKESGSFQVKKAVLVVYLQEIVLDKEYQDHL